jgi:hypothetical protein
MTSSKDTKKQPARRPGDYSEEKVELESDPTPNEADVGSGAERAASPPSKDHTSPMRLRKSASRACSSEVNPSPKSDAS